MSFFSSNLGSIIIIISAFLGIVLNGNFMKEQEVSGTRVLIFWNKIKKVSRMGWVFLCLTIAGVVVNDRNNNNDKANNEKIIADLEDIRDQDSVQKHEDSIKIEELKYEVKNNGLKSDSIKMAVVGNAIKEFEQQRIAIEKKYENIFLRFVNEVENNLKKIYSSYEEKHIRGFNSVDGFISTKLNGEYLYEYIGVTTKPMVIDHLMETYDQINTVNLYIESIHNAPKNSDVKKVNINMFILKKERVKQSLLEIYSRVNGLSSYKEYERINFRTPNPKVDEESLKIRLKIERYLNIKKLYPQ